MKAKSKAVTELISLVHGSPHLFKANDLCGFESSSFRVTLTGNGRFLSIVNLEVSGKKFPLTYRDKWAIEVAAAWWFKNARLQRLNAEVLHETNCPELPNSSNNEGVLSYAKCDD